MPNTGTFDADQRLRVVDRIRQRRRIAGAVAEKHAVGVGRQHLATPASSPDRRARRSRARSAGAGCSTSSRNRRRQSSAAASRRRGRSPRRTRRDPPAASRTPVGDVTPRTRSDPSIFGIDARALDERRRIERRRRCAITPRITPPDRSSRVSARVSMSAMATMPLRDEVVAQRRLRRASCSRPATRRER